MPSKTAKSERRKRSRKRPPSLVYVELPSGNGGMMRDLSEEGFAVRAVMPLKAGEKTSFSFSLNESLHIEGQGEILWVEENGRVAGVQFAEIPSDARAKMRDWLAVSEDPFKKTETVAKAAAPKEPALQELREEMLAAPPREESPNVVQEVPPTAAPEPVATASELKPIAPPAEDRPPGLREFLSGPRIDAPAPEPSAASPSIIESLPALQIPVPIEPAAEPIPPARASAPEVFQQTETPGALPPLSIPENETELPPPVPGQPDISDILIQPSSRVTGISDEPGGIERLSPWEEVAEAPRPSWTERFTLTRAIGIMVVLTFVVAFSAYHREVGKALIWLGEEMGGSEITQTQTADQNKAVTPEVSNAAATSSSSSNLQRSAPVEPAAAENNSQSSIPSAGKNALPEVTPLSRNSAPGSSDASQGSGEPEYLQAMQLLRRENADANMAQAVGLLWSAVAKGNASAEVALADLYWHGRGVVRNCDQARILLSTAARKGSTEAERRLQEFEQQGCE